MRQILLEWHFLEHAATDSLEFSRDFVLISESTSTWSVLRKYFQTSVLMVNGRTNWAQLCMRRIWLNHKETSGLFNAALV